MCRNEKSVLYFNLAPGFLGTTSRQIFSKNVVYQPRYKKHISFSCIIQNFTMQQDLSKPGSRSDAGKF
jgi:hypothetical protein